MLVRNATRCRLVGSTQKVEVVSTVLTLGMDFLPSFVAPLCFFLDATAAMIFAAFAENPGEALTKQDIADHAVAANPEYAEPGKRKLLMNSLGDQLNKRAMRDESGKKWTLPEDFMGTARAPGSGSQSPRPLSPSQISQSRKRKAAPGGGSSRSPAPAKADGIDADVTEDFSMFQDAAKEHQNAP